MNHQEKLNYMRIAAGIVGYTFEPKGLDLMVSLYDLIIEKKGEADLHDIVKVEMECKERELKRIVEANKKLAENTQQPDTQK